jgi:DNA-binding NarL/FixJ family response regulator
VLDAIRAGADGYLLKQTPPAELLAELRAVRAGGAPLTAGVARTVLDLLRTGAGGRATGRTGAPARLDLTDREQDVLRCLVQGLAYKQAASRLGISIDTVRAHVRNIYGKLRVHTAAEAVGRAVRERLV